jgi:hypothetical protein
MEKGSSAEVAIGDFEHETISFPGGKGATAL